MIFRIYLIFVLCTSKTILASNNSSFSELERFIKEKANFTQVINKKGTSFQEIKYSLTFESDNGKLTIHKEVEKDKAEYGYRHLKYTYSTTFCDIYGYKNIGANHLPTYVYKELDSVGRLHFFADSLKIIDFEKNDGDDSVTSNERSNNSIDIVILGDKTSFDDFLKLLNEVRLEYNCKNKLSKI